ncbi:MAG: GNAT family N-acetyltransferase, partial [Alphaproteobacteria bacterium HGW-Alphaproteobacteria-8]
MPGWAPPPFPPRAALAGRWCALEPLDPARHAVDLWRAMAGADDLWTYMFDGPFADSHAFGAGLARAVGRSDVVGFAIVSDGAARGIASFMRIEPAMGCIEIGAICFAPSLQRSRAATEALIALIRAAFALGYRRIEWKCDALNAPSRRLAQRLGFSFEGVFRNHMVVKWRNRDTAWYAMTDSDRPAL